MHRRDKRREISCFFSMHVRTHSTKLSSTTCEHTVSSKIKGKVDFQLTPLRDKLLKTQEAT
jgi:hypothetical protein